MMLPGRLWLLTLPALLVAAFAAGSREGAALGAMPHPLPALSYPAQVLRVIDGDTLEARVEVWPGHVVTTRVRIAEIDAPELRARCRGERAQAEAARSALQNHLADGTTVLVGVRPDKYFGRVVADIRVGNRDIGAALRAEGHAVAYGARHDWCTQRLAQR
jgi:micrococcal nuclease